MDVERYTSLGNSLYLGRLADHISDIHSDRFGPFVADYFRHPSIPKLKQMGLSLLRNRSSPLDSIIFTIIVNSAAYKFLTTTINLEPDADIALELRRNAREYRSAAQAAVRKIHLLKSPSTGLLIAILCGVCLKFILFYTNP